MRGSAGSRTALRVAAKKGRLLRANGKVLFIFILHQTTPRPFVLRLSKYASGERGGSL
jgi:hypothetical protein